MNKTLNVLIVEDDPMVALINRKYLESIDGLSVAGVVMDEESIIRMLDEEKVDLILLDIYLPKKNGIDILRDLRGKGYIVDIIMITAGNSTEEVKTAFAYGVTDYLVKPFDFNRFEHALNRYIEKRKLFNGRDGISQDALDKIQSVSKDVCSIKVPKGLNDRTLKRVEELLSSEPNKIWTVREISSALVLSNVTVKKYMDFLEEMDKVIVDNTSGNIGRPELLYKIKE